ncbi:MAG: F0F1 ATP synthase subunit delta [Gammaproteobacteria bacterium]|nr:F0F1 ATP synthase subunit delta [Gammaproteobacteria bacterium]
MSDLTTAARPYGRAAFEVACAHQEQERWTDMLAFMVAVAGDPVMRALLDSPALSKQQAAELFISVCKEQVDERGENFIRLLAENDRIRLLPEIEALYRRYRDEAERTVNAEVVSASDVDDAQLAHIREALKLRLGKEVHLVSRIDPALIGGAVIHAGDLVIDGSVRGRLDKLSTALAH